MFRRVFSNNKKLCVYAHESDFNRDNFELDALSGGETILAFLKATLFARNLKSSATCNLQEST